VDGLVVRYLLVVGVRVLDRTVPNAGRAARALVLDDVPGLLDQGDLEIPCFSFNVFDFGEGENLDIWMPADLDQFR
jgi:hypothetical protein